MKKRVWLVLAIAVLAFLFLTVSTALAGKVVASSYSDRYHESSCKLAQKIRKADLILFNSPQDAADAGLVPCKKCHPRVTSSNFGSQ